MSESGASPLDEAHHLKLDGRPDEALRLAIACLEADPQQVGAASLVSDLLVAQERPLVAGEALVRLVDAHTRRGDFGAAVTAQILLARAGENPANARATIARAFGKGSKRVGDVSPAPPPLPKPVALAPSLGRLAGSELLDRAEHALTKWMATDDPVAADAKLPDLPLVGSLAPAVLARFIGALELKDLATADTVISQGEEGREAFIVVRGTLRAERSAADGVQVTLAALGPGAVFGEMALVSDSPRAASVVAAQPSQVLAIGRPQLEQLARHEPLISTELGAFCQRRMVANLLRHSPILAELDSESRADLMSRFETCTFEPGVALLEQDKETDGLFLIASGHVDVMGTDADGDRLTIARLGPGDVVGEISLVLRRPATADVVSTRTTVALRLSRQDFQSAIQDHPTLLNRLYELATKREDETRSVVAQEAVDVGDIVLV